MAIVSKPYTFTVGEVILASEHNSNFNALFNLVNGNIDYTNLKTSAGILNAQLAAPNSYFTICITKTGQYTATVDPIATFQMPMSATLIEVSACARDLYAVGGSASYSIDVQEAGTTVLSAPISLTTDNTPVVGTVTDSTIADNAKMEIVLTLGGTTPALDDLTVLLTFKTAHV